MEIMSSEEEKEKNLKILKDKFAELNIEITPKEELGKIYNDYAKNWEKLIKNAMD